MNDEPHPLEQLGDDPMPLAPAAVIYTPQGAFWVANEYAQIKEWHEDEDNNLYDTMALVGLESRQDDQSSFRTYDLSLMKAMMTGYRSFSQESFEEQFGPKTRETPDLGPLGGLGIIIGGGGLLAGGHIGTPVAAKDANPDDECCCDHPAGAHEMPEKIEQAIGGCKVKDCPCQIFHYPNRGDKDA